MFLVKCVFNHQKYPTSTEPGIQKNQYFSKIQNAQCQPIIRD